jgi:PPOX class probable F420-dependent enzyme
LKRIRNLIHNPLVALIVDHYEEDWTQLGWVMIQGHAELLTHGNEHTRAQHRLKDRYPQLKKMKIDDLPVIAIRIKHIISWGELASS